MVVRCPSNCGCSAEHGLSRILIQTKDSRGDLLSLGVAFNEPCRASRLGSMEGSGAVLLETLSVGITKKHPHSCEGFAAGLQQDKLRHNPPSDVHRYTLVQMVAIFSTLVATPRLVARIQGGNTSFTFVLGEENLKEFSQPPQKATALAREAT